MVGVWVGWGDGHPCFGCHPWPSIYGRSTEYEADMKQYSVITLPSTPLSTEYKGAGTVDGLLRMYSVLSIALCPSGAWLMTRCDQ